MRTYWNVILNRSNGKSFERLVHYICVPIKGHTSTNMNDTEFATVARIITDEILSEIRSTYRTFGIDDISHCSLANMLDLGGELEGSATEAFKDRLQVKVNAMIQSTQQSTQQSLSSVFESTLEKYNSLEDFVEYLEDTEEEVYYGDYDIDDPTDDLSLMLQEAGYKNMKTEWCLLMVDIYTGTLTEVTVETNKDKTLDSILGEYLENGFECVSKKRLREVLLSA